jgi:hypothetical protein
MDRDASEKAAAERPEQLAIGTKHTKALIDTVGDDKLVGCRARHTGRPIEHAHAHLAHKRAVNTKHAHAVVTGIRNGDVTPRRHEAYSQRVRQLAVTAAVRPKPMPNCAVTTIEHRYAVNTLLRYDNDVRVRTHASRTIQDTRAKDRVAVDVRRQHYHVLRGEVRHEHDVVRRDPHLVRALQRQPITLPAEPRAIRSAEHVESVRIVRYPSVRHQNLGAVAAHSHTVAEGHKWQAPSHNITECNSFHHSSGRCLIPQQQQYSQQTTGPTRNHSHNTIPTTGTGVSNFCDQPEVSKSACRACALTNRHNNLAGYSLNHGRNNLKITKRSFNQAKQSISN